MTERAYSVSENSSTPPCDENESFEEEQTAQIFISWSGMLEPVEVGLSITPEELASNIDSGRDVAPPEHMQFIFKGLLLPEQLPLLQSGVGNGSVLHLVLNEEPYWGRPIYVRSSFSSKVTYWLWITLAHIRCEDGTIRSILCGEDFYIEDIKEELSCYAGQVSGAYASENIYRLTISMAGLTRADSPHLRRQGTAGSHPTHTH